MNPDTPRTDAIEFRHCPPQPKELLKKHQDAYALSRELERELAASKAEVERIRELLEKVLFELEKVPFQTPKLTSFTAHRLADRYRDQLNLLNK